VYGVALITLQYMMVTVDDIFHHIAQQLHGFSDADVTTDEFLKGCILDMHVSITTDVEDTELNYLERHGQGHTFYFRLRDYEHGKNLAAGIYFVTQGTKPDMSMYTGELFHPEDKLYLFVHVRNVFPRPATVKRSPAEKHMPPSAMA